MKHKPLPDWSRPRWEALVLVCKDCRKRSSGPVDLKTKAVVAEARQATKALDPRPRVVTTSCLGLCPKRAMAVAVIGGGGDMRITAIETVSQATGLLAATPKGLPKQR